MVELDVRIAGGGENAISKGKMELYDSKEKPIKLTNSSKIRYDVDASAASIKVIMPRPGDWKLTVNGVYGDDIHVGMLEHFKMNLKSRLVFPDQNPEGVVYAHDKVGIKVWLTYEDEDLTDEDLYKAVTSATATIVSRADESDETLVQLKRKKTTFTGSFTVPADSVYDVTIRVNWDTVFRESKLTLMSSNKPLELVGELDDITLNKNKSATIDNIYQCVYDEENDSITAEVGSIVDPTVCDVTVEDDKVVISGRKWSSTLVTIVFRDEQGNTVESTFKVKVDDPVTLALIIGSMVMLVLAALGAAYLLYKRTFKIRGMMRVGIIKELRSEDGEVLEEKIIFEDRNRLNADNGLGLYEYISAATINGARAGTGATTDADSFGVSSSSFGSSTDSLGASANQIGTTPDSFGATGSLGDPFRTDNPFGSNIGGFGTASVGEDPYTFAAPMFGDMESDDPFAAGSSLDASGGTWSGDQNSDDGPTPEEIQDERLHTSYKDGLLELGIIAGRAKSTNLLEVLKAFQASYVEHMTPMHRKSPKAEAVQTFVGMRLSALADVAIKGSPRGKQGIILQLPAKTNVVMESPRVTKGKVVTKQYGKKPIIFAFSLPAGGLGDSSYIEFEYLPPM